MNFVYTFLENTDEGCVLHNVNIVMRTVSSPMLVVALCTVLVFVEARFVDEEPAIVGDNAVSSEAKNDDDVETMETAEVYFRPLSRYRELQRKKNQTQEQTSVSARPAKKNYYQSTLLSKTPEYCLPAKGGVVCFYKV